MPLDPDKPLNCLLIHTEFSAFSFWNYKVPAQTMGAKTPSIPLGLITVAALLPQHWNFHLVDLNAEELDDSLWQQADIVCIGGMLPQQKGMLQFIRRARTQQKFVVVGGADPTSQPHIYKEADALVLDEGEITIPLWLESWRRGKPRGVFRSAEKPDVTKTPIPRFDLLKFDHYLHLSVQYSRGCPFNCEFCDIIELYGRKPRVKTAEQILAELETLYKLGYRGSVELVDDNFIGNKRKVKRELLPALIKWQKKHRYPFYFNTEASMNLGDDHKLLELMREAEFRYVFLGIESPDEDILLAAQKTQNTVGSIVKRIHTIQSYGMVVLGGFIMGFDGEKPGTDKSMIELIEQAHICMAMVGLLVALPNTQLSRRLAREGRLLSVSGSSLKEAEITMEASQASVDVVDQTVAGLNFKTLRPREEILQEYLNVIETIFSPPRYEERVVALAHALKIKPHYWRRPREIWRQILAFIRSARMFRHSGKAGMFWRTVIRCLPLGAARFEAAMRNLGMYLHYDQQKDYVIKSIRHQIDLAKGIKSRAPNSDLMHDEMKRASRTPQGVFLKSANSSRVLNDITHYSTDRVALLPQVKVDKARYD